MQRRMWQTKKWKWKRRNKSRATGREKCHAFIGYNWANAGIEEHVSSHGGREGEGLHINKGDDQWVLVVNVVCLFVVFLVMY